LSESRREPMVYAAAGIVFGFVLGYMAANSGGAAGPGVPVAAVAPATGNAAPAPGPASGPSALDPNEVSALESLARREPGNVDARLQLGNLYMDHERWDDAIRWYQEAIKVDPKNADARVDMGACLVNSGKAGDAVAVFDEALKVAPGHKKALFNKGIALMQSGRPKDAVALWEDLLKKYPDDPQLQELKAQIQQVRASMGRAS
jgi:cytochrome c-type biogenesis protein CcmH/NrfG